jgi:hypothetical protein
MTSCFSQKKKKSKKKAKPRKYFPLDNFSLGLGKETRFKNRRQTPDNVIGFAMLDTSGVENMLGARVRTWKTRQHGDEMPAQTQIGAHKIYGA